MSDWVKLNVGGTKFETTRATLTSCPDSLLAKMFDPDSDRPPAALSEDGYYLIDASPRAFAVILDWLRYKEILLGKEVPLEDVIPVADYFGLPELHDKLEALKKPVTDNNNDGEIIRLKVGGEIFETARETMMQKPGSKLAKMFTPGSKTSPPVTADGAYFIDASPRAFEAVLNGLRMRLSLGYNAIIYRDALVNVHRYHLSLAAKMIGLGIVFVDNKPYCTFNFD